jgi:hypothetical protein
LYRTFSWGICETIAWLIEIESELANQIINIRAGYSTFVKKVLQDKSYRNLGGKLMIINDLNEKLRETSELFQLFGIILFTSSHPHVIKMLKDEDYLSALNDITGNHIAVFATTLFQGKYMTPDLKPGQIGMMYYIWREPNENKSLLSWFGLKDSENLPLLILFGVDFENDDLYCQKYSIKANSPQSTYNLLQEALSAVSTQIEENINLDKTSLFKKASWEIKKIQAKQALKRLVGITSLLRGAGGM